MKLNLNLFDRIFKVDFLIIEKSCLIYTQNRLLYLLKSESGLYMFEVGKRVNSNLN
jgi:hypothetical protein